MRCRMIALALGGLITIAFVGTIDAQYQYRPAATTTDRSSSKEDGFDRAVDPARFRKGNFEWDTQELIKSGLTALHRDHVQILKDLAALQVEVERLAEEVRRLSAGQQP